MKRKWIYTIALLIIVPLVAIYFYMKYSVAPRIDFSRLNTTNLTGERKLISDYRGKDLILCFSASWCGPCLAELRHLSEVKETGLAGAEILVISDEPIEKVQALKEKTNYPFVFLKLEDSFQKHGIHSIPTTYILNEKFELVKKTVGYLDWNDPSTLNHIRTLLGYTQGEKI